MRNRPGRTERQQAPPTQDKTRSADAMRLALTQLQAGRMGAAQLTLTKALTPRTTKAP